MSKQTGLVPNDYAPLVLEVKERVRSAQYAALRVVNFAHALTPDLRTRYTAPPIQQLKK